MSTTFKICPCHLIVPANGAQVFRENAHPERESLVYRCPKCNQPWNLSRTGYEFLFEGDERLLEPAEGGGP